jgi:hypothetical protein
MLHRRKPLASDGHLWLLEDNNLGSRLRGKPPGKAAWPWVTG